MGRDSGGVEEVYVQRFGVCCWTGSGGGGVGGQDIFLCFCGLGGVDQKKGLPATRNGKSHSNFNIIHLQST